MEGNTRDIRASVEEHVVPLGTARHGLVVGINSYRDSRLNLRFARADAEAMRQLMIDPECGLFPPANVEMILDEGATRECLWRALGSLRRRVSEMDTLWVYFAGHAAWEGEELYWVPHDADVDDLFTTGLGADDVRRALEAVRCSHLVMLLDCCHTAAGLLQKNPTRVVQTGEELLAKYEGHGRIVLASSDGSEEAVELPDQGHGAFTYYLERGLRGEADERGEGVVTTEGLWNYLYGKVTDAALQAGRRQMPVLRGELRHGLPLTLNAVVAGRCQGLETAIDSLIGSGPERLTTDEAKFCIGMIRRGGRDEPTWNLLGDVEDLVARRMPVGRFKRLLAAARQAAVQTKNPSQPQPTHVPEYSEAHASSARPVGDATPQKEKLLSILKQLYLDGKLSKDIYQLGNNLLGRDAAELTSYDRDRRVEFMHMIEGQLKAEQLPRALDLIETPEQEADRLKPAKIASLLAVARANDSEEKGRTALSTLQELLRLDPQHSEALFLQTKIMEYYKLHYLKIDFIQEGGLMVLKGPLQPEHVEKPTDYYLGIRTHEDRHFLTQLVEDGDKFKLMAKSMIMQRIWGIKLQEERHPPPTLPADLYYYKLVRFESMRMWDRIKDEKVMAVRWPDMQTSDYQISLYMPIP